MILRALSAQGIRCFRNRIQLAEMDPAVNIIHGPNEAGKSTLVMAISLALFNRYRAQGQEIRELCPWGTRLYPEVGLEWESGGRRYRLEKRFLNQAHSSLYEWNGREFVLLAEGDEADEEVYRIMQARFPQRSTRGLTPRENWGLARSLWMLQGREHYSWPGTSEEVRDRLRRTLGSAVLGPADRRLIQNLSQAYQQIFTPKRGDVQVGSALDLAERELAGWEEKLKAAKETLSQAEARRQELEHWQDKLAALQAQSQRLVEEERKLEEEVKQYRDHLQQFHEAEKKYQALAQEVARLTQERSEANQLRDQIRDLEAEIKEQQGAAEALMARTGQLQLELSASEARQRQVEELAKSRRQELDQALLVKELVAERSQLEDEFKRLMTLEGQAQELKQIQAELDREPFPQAEVVRRAEGWQRQLDGLEAEIRAAGLKVELDFERQVEVSWQTPSSQGSQLVVPGEPVSFEFADQAMLALPGLGRICIRSGAKDLQKLIAERGRIAGELEACLAQYRAKDLEELRQKEQRGLALKQRAQELGRQQEEALRSAPPQVTNLADYRAWLEQRQRDWESKWENGGRPDVSAGAPDAGWLASLRQEVGRLEQEREGLNQKLSQLREQLSRSNQEMAKLQSLMAGLEGQKKTAQEGLEKKLAAYGGELMRLERAWQEAVGKREEQKVICDRLKAKLPPEDQNPEIRAQRLREQLNQVQEEARRAGEELGRIRGQLETLGAEGPYSQVAILEEKCELARREAEKERQKARVIKLLHQLVSARRQQMMQEMAAPVSQEVNRLFWAMTGEVAGAGASGQASNQPGARAAASGATLTPAAGGREVELSTSDLSLAGVRIGTGEVVSPEVFSGGTQEQLGLAMRLTLGLFLAQGERQLVVLDDPLINTDPERCRRVLEVLKQATSRLQFIILTCDPDRYQDLPGKRFAIGPSTLHQASDGHEHFA